MTFLGCFLFAMLVSVGSLLVDRNLKGVDYNMILNAQILEYRMQSKSVNLRSNPPVIYLSKDKYKTPQPYLWVHIVSTKRLKIGKFADYLILPYKRGQVFYEYYLKVKNSNKKKLHNVTLSDQEGVESEEILTVIPQRTEILGAWDVRKDKVLPPIDGIYAVVDKNNALPSDYKPDKLIDLSKLRVNTLDENIKVSSVIKSNLEKMFQVAAKRNIDLYVLSGFRSFDNQYEIYKMRVKRDGAEYADDFTARPGHSEHQLGTAVDFTSNEMLSGRFQDFEDTRGGRWLAKNAHRFGFIMSYPKGSEKVTGYGYEPWHFRYVGKKHAERIYQNDEIAIKYLKQMTIGN